MRGLQILLFSAVAASHFAAAQVCTEKLLVSGYNSNNVHIYDLCGGGFVRTLDTGGRLPGAQAVRMGNGFLYVASEESDRILRYDAETLAFVDVFVNTDDIGVSSPTALAIGADGDVYVAGFDSSAVVRLNGQSGAQVRRYELGGQAARIDAGMAFNADGRLLVPGFGSNNIVAIDVATGATVEWAGGVRTPRVIRVDAARARVLVTSWRDNAVVAFGYDGTFIGNLVALSRPTGLELDAAGNILVVSSQVPQVNRYSPDGVLLGVAVAANGVDSATFLTRIATPGVSVTTEPDQAWLIGVGEFVGTTMVAEMVITDGASFGATFDPADVRRQPWGNVEFEVVDCDNAIFSWQGLDPEYGQGSYPVVRVAPNLALRRCEMEGVDAGAAQGTWYGGAPRDGEGLVVDVLDDGRGVLTLYTYRPDPAAGLR